MYKLTAFLGNMLLTVTMINGQGKTQSIIYDATALMNAKHGVNALLIPTAVDFDIVNPATGEILDHSETAEPAFMTNRTLLDSTVLAILKRNAGLDAKVPESEVIKAYSQNPFLKDIFKTDFSKLSVDNRMKT